jgi:hypothetical protein
VIKNKKGKEKFAYKLNGYFLRAYDWEANNLNPVYGALDGKENPGGYDAVNRYGDEFYFAHDYSSSVWKYPGLNRFIVQGYLEKDWWITTRVLQRSPLCFITNSMTVLN